MKALRERKAAAQAAKSDKSGGIPGSNVGGGNKNSYLYRPYKCGLCDSAEETVAAIREHCKSVHENDKQFKCSRCDLSSDAKTDIETHFQASHRDAANSVVMIRIFYADPTSDNPAGAGPGAPNPGLVHNSILCRWLFTIHDHCKKVWF